MFAAPQVPERQTPLLQLKPVQHEPVVQLSLSASQPLGSGSQRPEVPQRMPRQHGLLALQVSLSEPQVEGGRQVEFTHTSDEQHAALAQELP